MEGLRLLEVKWLAQGHTLHGNESRRHTQISEPQSCPLSSVTFRHASLGDRKPRMRERCGEKSLAIQRMCSFPFPRPKNGGKYCVGRRMKFKSCNTEPCLKQKRDFRDEQCAQFDGKHFNINGLLPTVRWVPKYSGSKCNRGGRGGAVVGRQAGRGSKSETHIASCVSSLVLMKDRCKLFCRVAGNTAYYQLRDRVIDGTPCGQDTSDICVQGLCRVSPTSRFLHRVLLLSRDLWLPRETSGEYLCAVSREVVFRACFPGQHQQWHCLIVMPKFENRRPAFFRHSQPLWGSARNLPAKISYNNLCTHTFLYCNLRANP